MVKKIAFIGAGSMAEAIISGIIKKEFLWPEHIFVTNHTNQERLKFLNEAYLVHVGQNKQEILVGADIIVLSMKPYDIKSAIDSIKPFLKQNQIIISVAAGISTDYISLLIDQDNPVIRAMPNTSASIGLSSTALTKGKTATENHLTIAEQLFNTIGMTVSVEEKNMNVVTAISGSGPAYIYYLAEAMETAAIDLGLDADVAKALIAQTVTGAGVMLDSSGKTAKELRKDITSPSGTTEAGILTLQKYDFKKIVTDCVRSAHDRSEQLGKEVWLIKQEKGSRFSQ